MKETRKFIRIDLRFPVTVTVGGQVLKGEVQDFSEAGAYVSCPTTITAGTAVHLEISFKGDFLLANRRANWDSIRAQTALPDSLALESTVQWIIPPPRQGFGVKFNKMDKKNQQIVTDIARICAPKAQVA